MHPKVTRIDLIRGDLIPETCESMRHPEGPCSPEGKLFEKSDPLEFNVP